MDSARAVVEAALRSGEPVYGLTTGVAERKRVLLNPDDLRLFNVRMVHSHRIAPGAPPPPDVVRGAMLRLANSYARGVTGVGPQLCDALRRCPRPAARVRVVLGGPGGGGAG